MKFTFEDFVKSKLRNACIKEPGIEIYIRRSLPYVGTDFDLAALNARKPGKGALTTFLNKYEKQYTFFIENVFEDRLRDFFLKRGYQLWGVDMCPYCLYQKKPTAKPTSSESKK